MGETGGPSSSPNLVKTPRKNKSFSVFCCTQNISVLELTRTKQILAEPGGPAHFPPKPGQKPQENKVFLFSVIKQSLGVLGFIRTMQILAGPWGPGGPPAPHPPISPNLVINPRENNVFLFLMINERVSVFGVFDSWGFYLLGRWGGRGWGAYSFSFFSCKHLPMNGVAQNNLLATVHPLPEFIFCPRLRRMCSLLARGVYTLPRPRPRRIR